MRISGIQPNYGLNSQPKNQAQQNKQNNQNVGFKGLDVSDSVKQLIKLTKEQADSFVALGDDMILKGQSVIDGAWLDIKPGSIYDGLSKPNRTNIKTEEHVDEILRYVAKRQKKQKDPVAYMKAREAAIKRAQEVVGKERITALEDLKNNPWA